jgi:hypothetical protein
MTRLEFLAALRRELPNASADQLERIATLARLAFGRLSRLERDEAWRERVRLKLKEIRREAVLIGLTPPPKESTP